jgi:transposase-like protein
VNAHRTRVSAEKARRAAAERIEDLAWMAETGETLTRAAERLGVKPSSLERWCQKHCPEIGRRLRAREPHADWGNQYGGDTVLSADGLRRKGAA